FSSPSFDSRYRPPRALHPFPTRRSSDLPRHLPTAARGNLDGARRPRRAHEGRPASGPHAWATRGARDLRLQGGGVDRRALPPRGDRKSTRLNSSHQIISYAVFCLKKKKI